MPIDFVRLTGAAGDLKELEYVSALMQTDDQVRQDGSIYLEDVRLFIKSRYGIDATESELRERIFGSLTGPGAEKESIDVMDMLTLLSIPTLLKSVSADDDLPDELVAPEKGLLQYVLSMILHDTTGSHTPKRLDKRLLQRILISYGEPELALDEALLDEMLQAAGTCDGKLSLEAFSKALTGDVQLYDIVSETRLTTNYDDVFLTQNHRDPSKWRQPKTDGTDNETSASSHHSSNRTEVERKHSLAHKLTERTTAANIDMIAGTYRSKTLMVLLWASFCVSYYGYYNGFQFPEEECVEYEYAGSFSTNADALLCRSTYSIARWLILFISFSVYGLTFIGVGSIGNDIHCRRWYVPLIGAVGIFLGVFSVTTNPAGLAGKEYRVFSVVTIALGFLAIVLHICHAITILIPDRWLRRFPRFHWILEKQNFRGEVHSKKAAANKFNKLVCNALSIITVPQGDQRDRVTETHFGNALHAYAKYGQQYEPIGGFLWTWKRVWSSELFSDDGIWLSARLVASNIAQLVVVVFVFLAGLAFTRELMVHYEQETAKEWAGKYVEYAFDNSVDSSLVNHAAANLSHLFSDFLSDNPTLLNDTCASYADNLTVADACQLVGEYYECDPEASSNYLCTLATFSSDSTGNATSLEDGLLELGLLNASGLDSQTLLDVTEEAMQSAVDEAIDSLYPTEANMVRVPAIVGTIVATITALSLAVTYLPSTVSTILKLRCGMIPSLQDSNFSKYRIAVDTVTLLTGSLFWGCLIASAMVGGIVGFILFFFMWQATIVFAQQLVAILIGILTVVAIKWVLVKCCRMPTYKSFYRKRPATANIWNLALECANFALSVGFISARLIKLVFTAALYVGRVDVPFLAKGVGELGGLELDGYPTIFLRDVLAHEAHRHPYVELLGVLYLMHLRYDKHFGSRAGATWRLLFVYALMPWTNVYRILPSSDEDKEDDLEIPRSSLDFVSLRNAFDTWEASSMGFDMGTKPPSNLIAAGRERSTGTTSHEVHKEVHFQPPAIPPPLSFMKHATSGTSAKLASKGMSRRTLDQGSDLHPAPPAALMKRTGSTFAVQRGISKRQSLLAQELNNALLQELEEKNLELMNELQSLKLELARFEVMQDENGTCQAVARGNGDGQQVEDISRLRLVTPPTRSANVDDVDVLQGTIHLLGPRKRRSIMVHCFTFTFLFISTTSHRKP